MSHVSQTGALYKLGSGYVVTPPPFAAGRLVVTGPHIWSLTGGAGNDGYDYSAGTVTRHDAFVSAALDWLANAHSGLAILVANEDPTPNSAHFSGAFQTKLTALGNTVTLTGDPETWGGETLSDYDLLVMAGAGQTVGEVQTQTDAYLDAKSGSFLGSLAPGGFNRYGVTNSGLYATQPGRIVLAYCEALAGEHGLYVHSDAKMVSTTKTRPGTTTYYADAGGEKVFAFWENP